MLERHVVAASMLALLAILAIGQGRLTGARQTAPPAATAEVQQLVKQASPNSPQVG
jgi:hypothetical protein